MRSLPALDRLGGPPPALPRALDAVSEWWWGLPPRVRAACVGGALVVAGLALTGRLAPATDPPPVEVLVATRDLPPGRPPADGDLRTAAWPAALVPPDAADPRATSAETVGALSGPVPEGTVLTADHLDDGGLGALVADGRTGVAVPGDLVPERAAGARLELVATDDPTGARLLARAGRLLERDADRAWVEVDAAAAAPVAAAAHRRALAVLIRPA